MLTKPSGDPTGSHTDECWFNHDESCRPPDCNCTSVEHDSPDDPRSRRLEEDAQ